MSGAARRRPSAPENASLRNRRESAVVDLLIDRLADRLADRSGARHAPPWEPKQNVLLGVLEPIWVRPPAVAGGEDTAEDDTGEASETSNSAETEQATTPIGEIPSLGIDFRVRACSAEKVTLNVDVAFAVYLEEIATLDEQRTYLGGAVQAATTTGTPDGTGNCTEPTATQSADGNAAQGDGQSTDTAVQSTDSALIGSDGGGHSSANAGRRGRERKTRLLGAWRRHDINVPGFHIEVPLDGSVTAVSDRLATPAQSVIDRHYAQPNAMRPLMTKRNELPRTALKDEATFRAHVTDMLDMGWQPAYPDLELTAFAQALGEDDYLVSVALRNTTQLTGRMMQDLSAYDCQLAVFPAAETPLVPQRFELAPDDYRLVDLANVVGHGTGCVAVPAEPGGIRSDTLPAFTQP